MIAQTPVACPSCERLQKTATYWKDRALKAERERDQERQRHQQRRQLWKSKFKPAEKAMIEEVQRQLDSPQAVKSDDGFTRICYATAAINIGMSDKAPKNNIMKILEQCPDLPVEVDERKEYDEELKREIPRLYIKTSSNLIEAAAKSTISERIVQGGNQYQCQNPQCGSHNLKIERRLICLDCGHSSELEPTFPNGKLNNDNGKSGRTNLSSPPSEAEKILDSSSQLVGAMVITSEAPLAGKLEPEDNQAGVIDLAVIREAAALLLEVAGQDETHIIMPRNSQDKYKTIHRRLKLSDLVMHLQGGQARGASCRQGEGNTRTLAWDSDNDPEEWAAMEQAARRLAEVGYVPVLEPSPARPGGHMWIIFEGLVSIAAARQHVYSIAPELAELTEYWPLETAKGNRIRLPGGYYAHYGPGVDHPVKAWCRLFNVLTGEWSDNGTSNARLLLGSLTPVSAVPPITPDDGDRPAVVVSADDVTERTETPAQQVPAVETPASQVEQAASSSDGDPEVDAAWERKYGPVATTKFLFAITSGYAAAWFNERNTLEEIHPIERNRMAFSPNGNERTPSTSYRTTADGERYTDHSQHGRRGDGTRDTGDALELAAKVQEKPKYILLAEITKQIYTQARTELEGAANSGQALPAWLEQIITRAGRREYDRLFAQTVAPAGAPEETPTEQQSLTVDDFPHLREGMRVSTPAGIGTLDIIQDHRQIEALKALPCPRCSVDMGSQATGNRYLYFFLTEVQPIQQSTLL